MRFITIILVLISVAMAETTIDVPNRKLDKAGKHFSKAATLTAQAIKETEINGTSLAEHTDNAIDSLKVKSKELGKNILDSAKDITSQSWEQLKAKAIKQADSLKAKAQKKIVDKKDLDSI